MNFHTAISTPQQPATRKELRRFLRNQPVAIRAKVAADIATGRRSYQPSVAEAAAAVRTHARCVRAAMGTTPKPVSNAEVDRIVERIGADRLMAALDRYTAPTFSF